MPPTFALPPNTRAVGTANPAGDMDAVVNVMNNRHHNVFYLDDYGADPTGVSLSDAAFTACYSDATAALLTNSGAMIAASAGTYKFSVNIFAITDSRIGFMGRGKYATTITTTDTTGSVLKFTGATGPGTGAAPVCGFAVYGWGAGSSVNGVEYGNRSNGMLTDVTVTGFNQLNGRGFWFHDTTGISEGSFIVANADQNTVNYDFDGPGSFDYSHFYLHLVVTTAGGFNGTGVRFINTMHCNGSHFHLAGNASATTGLTTTVFQVGGSTSDTCHVQGTTLIISVEADTSAGIIKDFLVQGATSNAGIVHCNGTIFLQNTSGSYTAGTVTAPAVFSTAGFLLSPLFSSHGTLTAIGTGGSFSTYTG